MSTIHISKIPVLGCKKWIPKLPRVLGTRVKLFPGIELEFSASKSRCSWNEKIFCRKKGIFGNMLCLTNFDFRISKTKCFISISSSFSKKYQAEIRGRKRLFGPYTTLLIELEWLIFVQISGFLSFLM